MMSGYRFGSRPDARAFEIVGRQEWPLKRKPAAAQGYASGSEQIGACRAWVRA